MSDEIKIFFESISKRDLSEAAALIFKFDRLHPLMLPQVVASAEELRKKVVNGQSDKDGPIVIITDRGEAIETLNEGEMRMKGWQRVADSDRNHALTCAYCGESFKYDAEKGPTEDILKKAVDHEARCPKNPHLKKIEATLNVLLVRTHALEKIRSKFPGTDAAKIAGEAMTMGLNSAQIVDELTKE